MLFNEIRYVLVLNFPSILETPRVNSQLSILPADFLIYTSSQTLLTAYKLLGIVLKLITFLQIQKLLLTPVACRQYLQRSLEGNFVWMRSDQLFEFFASFQILYHVFVWIQILCSLYQFELVDQFPVHLNPGISRIELQQTVRHTSQQLHQEEVTSTQWLKNQNDIFIELFFWARISIAFLDLVVCVNLQIFSSQKLNFRLLPGRFLYLQNRSEDFLSHFAESLFLLRKDLLDNMVAELF